MIARPYRFHESFSFYDENKKPYNLLIEKNSDLVHSHSTVREDGYCVLLAGNKHFFNTVLLKNFKMKLGSIVRGAGEENFGFTIFLRYNLFRKEGYALSCSFGPAGGSVSLGIFRRNQVETIKTIKFPASSKTNSPRINVSLEANENNFKIKLNGGQFYFADENNTFATHGHIGFDKTGYRGELIANEALISSDEHFGREKIWGAMTYALPCVNGMSVPYKYTLSLSKYENGPYELDVELSGGIRQRPDRKNAGAQWRYEIDRLTTPYVRVETPRGEFGNIILHHGEMVLLDREENRPWVLDTYKFREWPLKRKIYFNDFPALSDTTFALGYEHFMNDPIRYAAGPLEVLIDSEGGVLYQGSSLRKGNTALSVTSSEDKLLCLSIPGNISDREKALSHARNNHYFQEGEKICFNATIYYHDGVFSGKEFSLTAQIGTVYGDILEKDVRCSFAANETTREERLRLKLGTSSLAFKVEAKDGLGAGVYHLSLRLKSGDQTLHEETKVFEVMSGSPEALPPPVASGLPWLYSSVNEIKHLETDHFDPWSERTGADAEHYFSICCFYPDFSRRKRIWELTKLYKRKWFLWLTDRTCDGSLSIDKNSDIIENCDYLNIPYENECMTRYDLWKFTYYKDEVLDFLSSFLRDHPDKLKAFKIISLDFLKDLRANGKPLPENAFIELFDNCWKEWRKYFSARISDIRERQYEKLKGMAREIKRSDYGPFPVYASHNKSVYFMKCFGYNEPTLTEKYYDGFFQYEDYPYPCGYSLPRSVFGLMTIKLYHPGLKIFPEIFDSLLAGSSDGAIMFGHPPYGIYDLPAGFTQKTIFEYCFAGVWFKDNSFNFWNDNGFNFRKPTRENIQELIGAWGKKLKHSPVKPVKTICFLVDNELLNNHPDHYEKASCFPFGDIYNTAEECLAYAYASARDTGLPAGFVTNCENLQFLDSSIVDLLVIPPLSDKTPQEHIASIRNLHMQGVNILGFENVFGLEDIFGVRPLKEKINIKEIGFSSEYSSCVNNNNVECVDHEFCNASYENDGGVPILIGAEAVSNDLRIPVLSLNETKWGKTAFFNIPPTLVRRDTTPRASYGRECLSPVIRSALSYVLKHLTRPCVKAENGKVIAFHDKNGKIIVVIEENSKSNSSNGPYIMLNMRFPNLRIEDVRCDKRFHVVDDCFENITLGILLEKNESALMEIETLTQKAVV